MARLFAVLRTHGPQWQDSRPLDGQAEWPAHASFMNALESEGFALLAGPLEGTRDALVIVRATAADEVRSRLAADPWVRMGLLQDTLVVPWTLRLGSLGTPMHDTQHISITIALPPARVYDFASDPSNLPRWAAGLARSEVRRDGDDWIADAPFGKVRVRFAERNDFGVLDHDVTLESGVTIHNPMRVVPHGEGSEFTFTLIRRPGTSDDEFARDKAAVESDLKTLKAVLEGAPGP